jgi:hypothetical protein
MDLCCPKSWWQEQNSFSCFGGARTKSKGEIQTRTEQEMRILADALRFTETTKIGGGGLTCEYQTW